MFKNLLCTYCTSFLGCSRWHLPSKCCREQLCSHQILPSWLLGFLQLWKNHSMSWYFLRPVCWQPRLQLPPGSKWSVWSVGFKMLVAWLVLRAELSPTALCLVGSVAAEGRFLSQNTLCHWKSKVWVRGSSLPVQRILCDWKREKEEFLAENCKLWSLQGVGETYGTNSWAPDAAGPTAALNCCWERFLTMPWDHPPLGWKEWGNETEKGTIFTTLYYLGVSSREKNWVCSLSAVFPG